MDVAKLDREAFGAWVGQSFTVSSEAGSFEAELIEVSPMGETPGPDGRMAFSAVFRGPATDQPLQQMHKVEHSQAGAMDLFLVPIGPDDNGMKYEAVFT